MEVHGKSVEFKYTCQYCNEVFPLKEMYDYHIKSKHERSVSPFYHQILYVHYDKKRTDKNFKINIFLPIIAYMRLLWESFPRETNPSKTRKVPHRRETLRMRPM